MMSGVGATLTNVPVTSRAVIESVSAPRSVFRERLIRPALRESGLPVAIDFVGPAYPPAHRRLNDALVRLDSAAEFLRYRGPVPFEQLHALSEEAEVFVFASSCENMPNTLLEAMAAGFPIACSRCGPMDEILGDAGVYFDPEDAASIAASLRKLVEDAELRMRCAENAHARAQAYSWKRCADETFAFIRRLVTSTSEDLAR